MTNQALVEDIRKYFEFLKAESSESQIEATINGISRSIRRITTPDAELTSGLGKIAVDLIKLYASQREYLLLRNKSEYPGIKVKPGFDHTFFESLGILKEELLKLLEKL